MAAFKPRGTPISARKKNMKNIASGLGGWDGSRLSLNCKEQRPATAIHDMRTPLGPSFLLRPTRYSSVPPEQKLLEPQGLPRSFQSFIAFPHVGTWDL